MDGIRQRPSRRGYRRPQQEIGETCRLGRVIEFQSVSKRYGEHTALAAVDLRCESGKTTALIGPSGWPP